VYRSVRAGNYRNAGFDHHAFGFGFVSHKRYRPCAWAYKFYIIFLAHFDEIRIFRQKPITGVNRVRAGNLRGCDDRAHIQIAVFRQRAAYADIFVGDIRVHRIPVGFGIHRDADYPHVSARPNHPYGDLTPVRDQYFLEHNLYSLSFPV
jgi:hypothetical protein